jgi:hypothetical protein
MVLEPELLVSAKLSFSTAIAPIKKLAWFNTHGPPGASTHLNITHQTHMEDIQGSGGS